MDHIGLTREALQMLRILPNSQYVIYQQRVYVLHSVSPLLQGWATR